MSYSISFKGFHQIEDFIVYDIEVTDLKTKEIWTFSRRYSALRRWFHQIEIFHPPAFPKKKIFGNKNPRFLENRQTELDSFFKAISAIQSILDSNQFKDFLFPKDRVLASVPAIANPKITVQKPAESVSSQKIADSIQSKLIDLSVQALPLENEDYLNRQNHYRSLIKPLRINANLSRLPTPCPNSESSPVRAFPLKIEFESIVPSFSSVPPLKLVNSLY